MNATQTVYLNCTEIRQLMRKNLLSQSEVPLEHAVSFPFPTLRSGKPGYAFFGSPAIRIAGQPMTQGAPDRWWILDAKSGHVVIYLLCSVQGFSTTAWTNQVIQPPGQSVFALRAAIAKMETELNQLAPAFLSGTAASQEIRSSLKKSIQSAIAPQLIPQYRELTPDFWAWLEATNPDGSSTET